MFKSKYKKQIKIILLLIGTLTIMTLIYSLSSQVAENSSKLSRDVAKVIINIVKKVSDNPNLTIGRLNYLVRKSAHFFAYMLLSIFVISLIRKLGLRGFKGTLISLSICILYAISDEIHQLYVPGRAGQVRDIFIDSAGATLGIIIYHTLRYISDYNKK